MYQKILFLDRDGTLIQEPESKQIDRLEQLQFVSHVIPALIQLKEAGYQFVMLSNQDGLGSVDYPEEKFNVIQNHILAIFRSQGINFVSVKICPHREEDQCYCRKPRPGLVLDYLIGEKFDKSKSYLIGDRNTDLELAKVMGITGILINQDNINDWENIAKFILSQPRIAQERRQTNETQIHCFINLDSEHESEVTTGIGFFDHMLEQLAKHAGFHLQLTVKGDIDVDDHHVVEDSAIVLGKTIRKALGDKWGIARYGFILPMDESLANIALDLSGRACLRFKAKFNRERVGNFSTEMVKHFFISLSESLPSTLHISCKGENTHHMIEAIFKGVGRTLRQAILKTSKMLPTTKGVL